MACTDAIDTMQAVHIIGSISSQSLTVGLTGHNIDSVLPFGREILCHIDFYRRLCK